MSLESILDHILTEARTEKEKILQQARQKQDALIQQSRQEAEKFYQEGILKEKTHLENERQKLLVNARLEAKKGLLKAKQELIDSVFEQLKSQLKNNTFKKQQVTQGKAKEVPEDLDFYLNKIRLDYESGIAEILFG